MAEQSNIKLIKKDLNNAVKNIKSTIRNKKPDITLAKINELTEKELYDRLTDGRWDDMPNMLYNARVRLFEYAPSLMSGTSAGNRRNKARAANKQIRKMAHDAVYQPDSLAPVQPDTPPPPPPPPPPQNSAAKLRRIREIQEQMDRIQEQMARQMADVERRALESPSDEIAFRVATNSERAAAQAANSEGAIRWSTNSVQSASQAAAAQAVDAEVALAAEAIQAARAVQAAQAAAAQGAAAQGAEQGSDPYRNRPINVTRRLGNAMRKLNAFELARPLPEAYRNRGQYTQEDINAPLPNAYRNKTMKNMTGYSPEELTAPLPNAYRNKTMKNMTGYTPEELNAPLPNVYRNKTMKNMTGYTPEELNAPLPNAYRNKTARNVIKNMTNLIGSLTGRKSNAQPPNAARRTMKQHAN